MKLRHTISICLLLLVVSCQKEIPQNPTPFVAEDVDISFSIKTSNGNSRSMDDNMESKIEEIDVLVFKNNVYSYRAEAIPGSIKNIGGGVNHKEFTVTLATDNQSNNQLIILANARSAVTTAETNGHLKGNKAEVLKNVVFENNETDGRWPAALDGTNKVRAIPMSGESGFIKISKELETYFDNNPIPLYRALTRIDVKVDERVNNFELTHLYIYRYNCRGCVAISPDAIWDVNPHTNQPRIRTVSLPDNPETKTEDDGYLEYDLSRNSSTNSIYLLESERADRDDYSNATCLLVGGRYQGGDITYYRIEFEIIWQISGSEIVIEAGPAGFVGGGWQFARMLRNHLYEVTIYEVTGPGKKTLKEARGYTGEGYKYSMIVNIRPWTDFKLDMEF